MLSQEAQDILFGNYVLNPDSFKKLLFFRKKYRYQRSISERYYRELLIDLVKICDVLFNDIEFLNFEKHCINLSEFLEYRSSRFNLKHDHMYAFLKLMDDFRAFYELNKNASIKDKRQAYMRDLKNRFQYSYRFLQTNTKKRKRNFDIRTFYNLFFKLEDAEFLC